MGGSASKSGGQAAVVTTTARATVKVKTISGHEIDLLHQREKKFFESARDKYLAENVFTAASDMRALDRRPICNACYCRA